MSGRLASIASATNESVCMVFACFTSGPGRALLTDRGIPPQREVSKTRAAAAGARFSRALDVQSRTLELAGAAVGCPAG